MKKIITMAIAATMLLAVANTANAQVNYEKLPATAQETVKKHFANSEVSYVKIDSELFSKEYEVVFTNGAEIDFDGSGKWTKVNCKREAVPESIVPVNIANYAKKNFAKSFIKEIDRERKGYKVELSNDVELMFDANGNFRKID